VKYSTVQYSNKVCIYVYVYITLGIFIYPAYAVPYRTMPCGLSPLLYLMKRKEVLREEEFHVGHYLHHTRQTGAFSHCTTYHIAFTTSIPYNSRSCTNT
jgi:hypothetical protein